METINASAEPSREYSVQQLDEVRRRRVLAFCVDYVVIAILVAIAAAVVAVLGILTLGLGWLLYGILVPLVALCYFGFTMGGAEQASVGMRMFSIKLERTDGGRIDFWLAVVHAVIFWAGNVLLSPLILVISLFSRNKRLLQDILLGTVVVRT